MLHCMSDVNPYYYDILNSAFDHKGGNNFSVVLFQKIVYNSANFFLVDAISTSY